MPGSIQILATFPTVDFMSAVSPARGMAFKTPSDGNIYLAVLNTTFLALRKNTGAVVFATNANDLQFKTNWHQASDSFLNSSAGGAPNFTIARLDGTGTLTGNPATGANPYGAIIANGKYFAGDTGDNFVTVLDAATGAAVTSIDTTVSGPTAGVGQWANDGSSLWCTATNAYLIQIDPVTLTLQNIYDLTGQGMGRIRGICFAMGFLWLTDTVHGHIWKVDLAGNVITSFFAFGSGPILFDGTYFWLMDLSSTLVSCYDSAATLQTLVALTGQGQDIAHDPTDPPGTIWATSGGGIPSQVQKLKFVPPAPPAGGAFEGTHVGFLKSGHFGGGTK